MAIPRQAQDEAVELEVAELEVAAFQVARSIARLTRSPDLMVSLSNHGQRALTLDSRFRGNDAGVK